jgi:membrane associated rhomboid family serine protease
MSHVERDSKKIVVNTLIISSIAVFAVNKRIKSSTLISMNTRLGWDRFVSRHLSFNRQNPIYTCFTYSITHHSWKHLALNVGLLYVLGNALAESERFKTGDLLGMTAISAVSAAATERPFLRPGIPLVGASGVAMGYLGSLAIAHPDKEWMMMFPFPGFSVTSQQLIQATVGAHILALLWGVQNTTPFVALRGHIGGLVGGAVVAALVCGVSEV